jgi:predicted ATPase
MVPAHFASVPSLAKSRTFEFKPGINVLYGENGSGKTTLLNAIAKRCSTPNRATFLR